MPNINLVYMHDDYSYLKINCYDSYILYYSHLYAPSCGATIGSSDRREGLQKSARLDGKRVQAYAQEVEVHHIYIKEARKRQTLARRRRFGRSSSARCWSR
jgi:hypothetical protein